MVNLAKKNQVDALSTALTEKPHFALVKYEKTSHKTLEEIRKTLKKSDSNLKIIKNSLLERALNRLSNTKKELQEARKSFFPLKENSALLTLGEDYVGGLSAFYKYAKDSEGMSFKWGFLEGALYGGDSLVSLAKLPPKIELQAKVIGYLKSPAQRLVGSLNFGISKLVFVLNERGKQGA